MKKLPKTLFAAWNDDNMEPWLSTGNSAEEVASGIDEETVRIGVYELKVVKLATKRLDLKDTSR